MFTEQMQILAAHWQNRLFLIWGLVLFLQKLKPMLNLFVKKLTSDFFSQNLTN